MRKGVSVFLIVTAAGLSLAGIIGFLFLILPRMNAFWIVLAPVIFAVYQIPAVAVYALWKRGRTEVRAGKENPPPPEES